MVLVDSLSESQENEPLTARRRPFVDMLAMMAKCLIWRVIFSSAAVNLLARHFVAKAGIH